MSYGHLLASPLREQRGFEDLQRGAPRWGNTSSLRAHRPRPGMDGEGLLLVSRDTARCTSLLHRLERTPEEQERLLSKSTQRAADDVVVDRGEGEVAVERRETELLEQAHHLRSLLR